MTGVARYLFWFAIALPGAFVALAWALGLPIRYLGVSGQIAAIYLVSALAITPLSVILNRPEWALVSARRAIGIAAFGHAALHLMIWLSTAPNHKIIQSFSRPEIVLGWIAFAVLAVLASISNAPAQRLLGRHWKPVQRLAYGAALATFLHWWWVGEGVETALLWFGPLGLLQALRLLRNRLASEN